MVAIDCLESHRVKVYFILIALASCFEVFVLGTRRESLIDQNLPSLLNLPVLFNYEYPWTNLIVANLIVACVSIIPNVVHTQSIKFPNNYLAVIVLVLSFHILSVQTELQRYGLVVTSSSYRVDNFTAAFESFNTRDRLVNNNYRVLLTGREDISRGDSMNIKSVPWLELNNVYGFKTMFQYREVEHPYLNIIYNSFACLDCNSMSKSSYAYMPPKSLDVIMKKELLSFLAIRYVISIDERIQDKDFKLLDSYEYKSSPRGVENSENGFLFLYQFEKGRPIAKIQGKCNAETRGYSLANIFQKPTLLENLILEYPFGKEICDSLPESASRDVYISNDLGNKVKVKKFHTDSPVLVDFSIINRKGWRAFDNGIEVPILVSYDGLIAMHIGPGDHLIELRYQDKSLLVGFLLVFSLFLYLTFNSFRSRKTNLQVQ